MENLVDFLGDNLCIQFFINGLAFFGMGLAVALESRRVSTFAMSQSLPWLAGYAFAASASNWIQMFYVGLGHVSTVVISPFEQALKLSCFALAGALLLAFGTRLVVAHGTRYRWLRPGLWVLLVGYVAVAVILHPLAHGFESDWASIAEMWARYLLYAPALALAGVALLVQRRDFVQMKLFTPARDSLGAAFAFGLKLVVSSLIAVPILDLPGPIASAWILFLQLVRTLTTVAIAYSVLRILRVFEMEQRRQLDLANQERFQAQNEALAAQQRVCAEIQQWSTSMAHAVHAISSAISQPSALEETVQAVLRNTLDVAGLESGAVFLLEEEEPVLRLVAHEGLPPWVTRYLLEVKVGDGLAGWVAQTGELLILDDIANDPRPFVPRGSEVVKFYVGIPLKAGGRLMGVMNLSSSKEHRLSPEQVALLAAAGHQLGVAFEDARLHGKLLSMAAVEERARLSRELHDSLVQVMGYLNLKVKVMQGLLVSNQVSEALGELRDMEDVTGQAYDDVRDSILALRVRVSPDEGLKAALEEYIPEFGRRSGIDVTLETPAAAGPFFTSDTAIQVLRIIQEALTNVRRHAKATQARVAFKVQGDTARIVIQDNGRGFDPSRSDLDGGKHLGLLTMRERTESVGGNLNIDSQVGRGTKIELSLPVRRERRLWV